MKEARFFISVFVAASLLFLVANFILWEGWVSDIRPGKYAGGDLARMGYVHGSRVPRQAVNDYPVRHIDFPDYRGESVDIVTIGDSFTNPVGLGENIFYTDFLASEKGMTVLNVPSLEEGKFAPEKTIIKLLNAGFFEEISPRYVILQTVERSAVQRFGEELDFSLKADEEDLGNYTISKIQLEALDHQSFKFMTMANLKFLVNSLHYLFSDHSLDKSVYVKKLNTDLFNVKNGDLLLHARDDIKNLRLVNRSSLEQVNRNLNRLAERLRETGTKLIFMPAPDKFNLYRKYMVEENLPESRFFEGLRPLEKNYVFLDTKAILARELETGTKDLYYADDTHWTSKAIKAIFSPLDFESSLAENLKSRPGQPVSPI